MQLKTTGLQAETVAAIDSFPLGLASLLKLASPQLVSLPRAPLLAPAEPGQGWRGMGHFSELSLNHLPSVPWRVFSFLSPQTCTRRTSSKTDPLCVQQAKGGVCLYGLALADHPGEG